MTDQARGIAVMETSAPAIEEARTPAKEEGEEGEESSAGARVQIGFLVRLMNRAPSAAMIIAQLARSREGIAYWWRFTTCPEKLGSFMNRVRELEGVYRLGR